MRLEQLLAALPPNQQPKRIVGANASALPIRGIAMDSRRVSPGDLFVALRGEHHDGHDHLAEALSLGAAALLIDRSPPGFRRGTAVVVAVPDCRRALPTLAAAFYGMPSRELDLIGVTGTNGKTSTTYIVESMLREAGRTPGLVGTVEVRFGDERQRALNTTPESLELQQLLRAMCNHHVDAVAMEVSSHGLSIGRTDGCAFRVAAFTNLTQDHLDFHETMESYCEAKLHLFRELLRPEGHAVVHLEDAYAARFVAAARHRGAEVVGVARAERDDARLWLRDAETTIEGSRATLVVEGKPVEVRCPLLGSFNLDNFLVAAGIGAAIGLPLDAIARGIERCPQVPGRLERVDADGGEPTVLVDYAHTPDAVEKLLVAVREMTAGPVITVFGCGGDRDRRKRAPMAQAVARHSDRAIATSDNPRSEDPARILADVEVGLDGLPRLDAEMLATAKRGYTPCVDRREAIALAIALAGADETVVIAGKGHEDYQIVGRERLPFDDRAEARRALANWSPR